MLFLSLFLFLGRMADLLAGGRTRFRASDMQKHVPPRPQSLRAAVNRFEIVRRAAAEPG
jgi:hypothetical protein